MEQKRYTVLYDSGESIDWVDYYSSSNKNTAANKEDAYRQILKLYGPEVLKAARVLGIYRTEELNREGR